MYSYKKSWLAGVVVAIMLWTLGTASCTNTTKGSDSSVSNSAPGGHSEPSKSISEMLADISKDVGQVRISKEGSGDRQVCVFEERHNSVAAQIEIALMLLRLHDRYGLRDIALEGLTKDREFPSIKWFRDMGGPDDSELRNQIAVGLLRQGEIGAVELIALAFPNVVVHAADDPTAYLVELTKKAGIASTAYFYKIGFKSVRPEHHQHIQQLSQQKKIRELVEYVISLDAWAKERDARMKKETGSSIEQTLATLQEIENRATVVGAEIGDDERSAMAEAKAFFAAAEKRTGTIVQATLEMKKAMPLVAMNVGAAHTEGVRRMLDEAKATYGVLTPLSLAKDLKAGDLSYEAFNRKNKQQSVMWLGKGLGSMLDGRHKYRPNVGMKWFQGESQLRFVTALLARASGQSNFPDAALRQKVDRLEDVKVSWKTVKTQQNGDVDFTASVLGEKGWITVSTRCGIPKGAESFVILKGRTLEQLLNKDLDEVRKEAGERKEPEKGPVIEMVTPDVMAAYDKEPNALANISISG